MFAAKIEQWKYAKHEEYKTNHEANQIITAYGTTNKITFLLVIHCQKSKKKVKKKE